MLGSDLDLVMAAGHPFYDNDHQKLDAPDYSFMYEDGLSVMIEGGAIDWAGHGNNPVCDIEETQDFNKSVDAAIKWEEENSSWEDTLLVVTAYHETVYLSGANEAPTDDISDAEGRFNAMEGEKGKVARHGWYSGQHTNQLVPFFFKSAGSEDIKANTSGTDSVRGDFIDNTLVANLVFDEWWDDDAGSADESEQLGGITNPADDAGKKGSSKGFAAGLATGLGILGAVVGGLGFLATQMGVLNIDLKPIYEQLKRVGLR